MDRYTELDVWGDMEWSMVMDLNPCRTEVLLGNIKIYFHFLPFLNPETVYVSFLVGNEVLS